MIRFRSYDGTELAYREEGTGPALVCLPGGPGRSSRYLLDLGGLPATRRLILLDNRGTGASAVPADPATYAATRMVADVEALRIRLGLDRMDLLAHSAAGSVGLLYAIAHPQRIRRLVLVTPDVVAAGVDITDEEWNARIAARSGEPWYETRLADLRAWEAGDESRRLAAQPFFYSPWNEAAEAHASDYAQRSGAAAQGFRVGMPPVADVRGGLAALTAPVLVIAGENDPAPAGEHAAALAALCAEATAVVVPGAHYPWVTAAAVFAEIVEQFLAR